MILSYTFSFFANKNLKIRINDPNSQYPPITIAFPDGLVYFARLSPIQAGHCPSLYRTPLLFFSLSLRILPLNQSQRKRVQNYSINKFSQV